MPKGVEGKKGRARPPMVETMAVAETMMMVVLVAVLVEAVDGDGDGDMIFCW